MRSLYVVVVVSMLSEVLRPIVFLGYHEFLYHDRGMHGGETASSTVRAAVTAHNMCTGIHEALMIDEREMHEIWSDIRGLSIVTGRELLRLRIGGTAWLMT